MATANVIALYIYTSVAHASRLNPGSLLDPLPQLSRGPLRRPSVQMPRTHRAGHVVSTEDDEDGFDGQIKEDFAPKNTEEFKEIQFEIGILDAPQTELEKKQAVIIENLAERARLEDNLEAIQEEWQQIMAFGNGAAAYELYEDAKYPLEEELAGLKDKEEEALQIIREVNELQAKIKQVRSDIKTTVSQHAEMQIKCSKLETELEETVAERTKADASRADCERQLEKLPEEVARAKEALVASEEAVVNGLARLEKIQAELVELRSKETEASAKAVAVSNDLEERSTARADLQRETDALDVRLNSLHEELKKEEDSLDQLKSHHSQVEGEVEKLPKAIEETRAKKTRWTKRLEKLQSTIKPNEEELAVIEADLDATKTIFQTTQKVARNVRSKLLTAQRERKQLEEQSQKLEATIADETNQAEKAHQEMEDITQAIEDLQQRRDHSKRVLADALLAQAEYHTSDSAKAMEAMAIASLSGRDMDEKVAFSGRALELAAQEAEGQLSVLRKFQDRMQDVIDTSAQQRLAAQQQLEAIAATQAKQAEELRTSLDTMTKDMEDLGQSVTHGLEKTVSSNGAQLNSLQDESKKMRAASVEQDSRFESMIGELKERAAVTKNAVGVKSLEEEGQLLLKRMQQLRNRREAKLSSTSGEQLLEQQKFEKTAAVAAKGIMDFVSSAFQSGQSAVEHSLHALEDSHILEDSHNEESSDSSALEHSHSEEHKV